MGCWGRQTTDVDDGRVAVRDRATGHYLAAGPAWSPHGADALRLEPADAADWVRRFACEPAVEVVDLTDRRHVA
jgi:hypothetical protein